MNKSSEIFSASAGVFNLIYKDKNTSEEAEWITDQLRLAKKLGHPDILEIGAGTGRHARAFGDAGFAVTAVEPSIDMLKASVPHEQVRWFQGDGETLRLGKEFDAVVALFHVVSYHTSLTKVAELFKTVNLHLKNGGIFGFDVWYTPAVIHKGPEDRVLTKEDDNIRVTRVAHPLENLRESLVDVHYSYSVENLASGDVSTFQEVHQLRHFTETEVQLLAEQFGFSILDAREFMTDREPSRDTWGVWFSLQKV